MQIDRDDLIFIIVTAILALLSSLGMQANAQDISANYLNTNFEPVFEVDKLQSIEMWEQPRTQYTPKNLQSEQQMRFSGKLGTNQYNSYTVHLTDYDTKIVESQFSNGKFYIKDNTGKTFVTGVDNSQQVQQLNQAVQSNSNNIKAMGNNLQRLDYKTDRIIDGMYRLDNKIDKGLATVTALTSLHPNPRAKGRTQVAIGGGMYNNNVAGAVGIFHHINNHIMISVGASYGGSDSWAGNVGLSIGF